MQLIPSATIADGLDGRAGEQAEVSGIDSEG
jgi:hypothetical protein